MKKTLPILAISLLLCVIMYSCITCIQPYHTIYCGKLKDALMFVPQSTEQGDVMLLYNNKKDSLSYVAAKVEFTADEENFESNCDCICSDNFVLELTTATQQSVTYKLRHSYRDRHWQEPIAISLSVNNRRYSFDYTVGKDSASHNTSAAMFDSLTVNKVSYRDVVELKDSVQTIHVAKDCGIVQIIESDSTLWTLNKWES